MPELTAVLPSSVLVETNTPSHNLSSLVARAIPRFQEGGLVKPESFYVQRQADADLLALLEKGEYCFIMGTRQSGKSSLRDRTATALRDKGILTAVVDSGDVGATDEEEDWFYSTLEQIQAYLPEIEDPSVYWKQHQALPPEQKWWQFLHDEVLQKFEQPVVIFIDEIDVFLETSFFKEKFLPLLRAGHDFREQNCTFKRLTFCLVGGEVPWDLWGDDIEISLQSMPWLQELVGPAIKTPFGICHQIVLFDFTFDQTKTFLPGFGRCSVEPEVMLQVVYDWTDGHPYMMQRLGQQLVEAYSDNGPVQQGKEAEAVESIVRKIFISTGRYEDSNLAYTNQELELKNLRGEVKPPSVIARIGAMRYLYGLLLRQGPIAIEPNDQVQIDLWLSGIAVFRDGYLKPRNKIFVEVFGTRFNGYS